MRNSNKIGPDTEPCGTPDTIVLKKLFDLFIWVHPSLRFKWEQKGLTHFHDPHACNFATIRSYGMHSNALGKIHKDLSTFDLQSST